MRTGAVFAVTFTSNFAPRHTELEAVLKKFCLICSPIQSLRSCCLVYIFHNATVHSHSLLHAFDRSLLTSHLYDLMDYLCHLTLEIQNVISKGRAMCWIWWVTLGQNTLSTDNWTPMSTVVLGQLAVTWLIKKYCTILRKPQFLTVMLTLTRPPMDPILRHLFQSLLHTLTI